MAAIRRILAEAPGNAMAAEPSLGFLPLHMVTTQRWLHCCWPLRLQLRPRQIAKASCRCIWQLLKATLRRSSCRWLLRLRRRQWLQTMAGCRCSVQLFTATRLRWSF